ncbi:hypothetical protein [Blastopirellula marina]|uniref:Uncharacterized protein n=1 Tax=Blastopirellula marina TaxID=124 RepID=A0A2S8GBR2_9BACT|nr:hypothetical protein [Blastopirellula marina]PQO41895.1 hypothetical protein C5Y98_02335 [Blastopirellula marina]PTL46253.1 hypothetical protein C5Y97_02335 [Blastopirellula marina]
MLRPLFLIGFLIAASTASAAERESLDKLAQEHQEFAWSIKIEEANGSDNLYGEPGNNHFRRFYQADSANQKKQTWTQYEGWIKTFYSGNLLVSGWKSAAEKFCQNIQAEEERKEAVYYLNVLGRVIAAEWAKDAKHARITSADVQKWATELTTLEQKEGQRLAALKKLAKNVSSALASDKQISRN